MGRHSDLDDDTTAKLHLRRVRMVDGDYDPGGAYWGGYPSPPLWCAWDDEGRECYVRAGCRREARSKFPNARFYR